MPVNLSVQVDQLDLSKVQIRIPLRIYEQAGELVAAGIVQNILKQKQADGTRIKRNSRSTRKSKLERGLSGMSLIDEGRRLVRGGEGSFRVEALGQSVVVVPNRTKLPPFQGQGAWQSPRDLSEWVQRKGYTGWFGVSGATRKALKLFLTQEVRKIITKEIQRAKRKKTNIVKGKK